MNPVHEAIFECEKKLIIRFATWGWWWTQYHADIFFKEGPGSLQSVFGSQRTFWSERMKNTHDVRLSFWNFAKRKKEVVDLNCRFHRGGSNERINIYVSPDSFFETKFRTIFKKRDWGTLLRLNLKKKWLSNHYMDYWSQQPNFALFCATQGCGISREIFVSGQHLPSQIRGFFL